MPVKRTRSNQHHPGFDLDQALTTPAIADFFRRAAWKVKETANDGEEVDLTIRRGSTRYSVEFKLSSEGRADRLVPLWAQAYLQAKRRAPKGAHPLAIVAAPAISDRVLRQIVEFAQRNAPEAAIGVLDRRGLRHFEGKGLLELNARAERTIASTGAGLRRVSLFTDINQWLMKVLLAPWIPPQLTGAPRAEYRNATELARAAKVSVMSAFRLVEALRSDHHLDERRHVLRPVRRRELLKRWREWSSSSTPHEIPAVFIIPGDPQAELRGVLHQNNVPTALALFAAADALRLGFVRGAPPHVYLPALTATSIGHLENVRIAGPDDRPGLILRQPRAIQSVFRGAVQTRDGLVTDVLQTWLDVSSHPTRGHEQANLIERRALQPLLEED